MSSDPNQSYRNYTARMFSRGALVCPRCRDRRKDPVDSCPQCGFDFGTTAKAFPFAPPPLSLLIDPSSLLPPCIEGEIQRSYEKVRKRFPEVDFSFCFLQLQPGVAIQEFAFWLHNAAPDAGPERAWQILVVGDLTSGRLALTTGYALEPFLSGTQWEAALQELAACIADHQWKEGLDGFLTDALDLLSIAWAPAERLRRRHDRTSRKEERRAAHGADGEESPSDQNLPPCDASVPAGALRPTQPGRSPALHEENAATP